MGKQDVRAEWSRDWDSGIVGADKIAGTIGVQTFLLFHFTVVYANKPSQSPTVFAMEMENRQYKSIGAVSRSTPINYPTTFDNYSTDYRGNLVSILIKADIEPSNRYCFNMEMNSFR